MSRILLILKGSFGDVFPMISIALRLREQGHHIVCASRSKRTSSMLAAFGFEVLNFQVKSLGNSPAKQATGLRGHLYSVIGIKKKRGLLGDLASLIPEASNADLLIGNQVAFEVGLLAEHLGKKWVYCAISPLAVYSRRDPSLFPVFHALPTSRLDWAWLRRCEAVIARVASRIRSNEISRERQSLGLDDRGHPLFEGKFSPHLNLFLCSQALITPQSDWPEKTVLTGFCWLAPAFSIDQSEEDALRDFLDNGSAPVVLTLGSESRGQPGQYYHTGIKACRQLGLRAIVVANRKFHSDIPKGEDVFVTTFLPYSKLLPRALLVVHSAGIGTLGWCLRYGKYSILSPASLDQFDTARRAEQKGFAKIINRRHFSADRLAKAIAEFLALPDRDSQARRIAQEVANENGALIALQHIEALLA